MKTGSRYFFHIFPYCATSQFQLRRPISNFIRTSIISTETWYGHWCGFRGSFLNRVREPSSVSPPLAKRALAESRRNDSQQFPNRARSRVSRKRDAPACCSARSCDLRRPCAGGRATRRPSSSFLRRTHARPRARFDRPLCLLPVKTQIPAVLRVSPPSRSPVTRDKQCAFTPVNAATSAEAYRCCQPCPRECISLNGPLEGAPVKGSPGGKSVSAARTSTRSLPRFFLFTHPPRHRVPAQQV